VNERVIYQCNRCSNIILRITRVWFLGRDKTISFCCQTETDPGAHPASWLLGMGILSWREMCEVAKCQGDHPTPSCAVINVGLYVHLPTHFQDLMLRHRGNFISFIIIFRQAITRLKTSGTIMKSYSYWNCLVISILLSDNVIWFLSSILQSYS
jgi:hypothetical protein